jgi:glycyl-tRNA synthetase beta chain
VLTFVVFLLVSDLQSQQEDQMIERKGPALSAPAQAVEGFAKSCGVDINALDKRDELLGQITTE